MLKKATAKKSRLERRHLTVMFCDLVNSTALSLQFDAEELREIITAYLTCCADVVRQFKGHIARCTGDGLLVYFGFPKATERDAESAIRAGLAIVSAVQQLAVRPNLRLQTRVGIATGQVVAGASQQRGEIQEPTIVGATPNLAARLLALAKPDSVIIAETTRRLAGNLFEVHDVGRRRLKGFAHPVQAWQVIAASPVTSRSEFTGAIGAVGSLVNRRNEMEILQDRWRSAQRGQGQAVLLVGEPGIGKSRLARALIEHLRYEENVVLRHYCSPFHQNTPLYPIIRHLERAAQFVTGDSMATKLDKLEAMLSRSKIDVHSSAPLFAALLSIKTEGRYPPLALNAPRRKQRTLEMAQALLDATAREHPVLVVFEDLQWLDPTTHELLDRLVKRLPEMPVLLLMTARPEFTSPWDDLAHFTKLVLNRLDNSEAAALVRELRGATRLPQALLKRILALCDGVPLHLEELTKTVIEAASLGVEGDRSMTAARVPDVLIPETLQDSLMARLDRLGPWVELIKVASTIGQQFSYDLLHGFFEKRKNYLDRALQKLIDANLIVRLGNPTEGRFAFKHALVRDAAYASIVSRERQALHARVAHLIERFFPEIAEREPELLARHYSGAQLIEPAVRFWRKAGEQSLKSNATIEAINHLQSALELLLTMPENSERDQTELDLQLLLGATFAAVKGFAAPEVERAYGRAHALTPRFTDMQRLFPIIRGLWMFHLVRANWSDAYELAKKLLAASLSESNVSYRVEAHRSLGVTLFWLGNFASACEHFERARLLYDREQHHEHVLRYGSDPAVASLVHEAYALWILGYPDSALRRSEEALILARELKHPFGLAQALLYRSFLHQHRREADSAMNFAQQARTLAEEQEFPFWLAESTIVIGWAKAQLGKVSEGLEQIRQGIADFFATGARMDRPRWLSLLAEIYGVTGSTKEALGAVSEALAAAHAGGERFHESRIHCLKGNLLLSQGPEAAAEAEACFVTAIHVARQQGARAWELCAATSLARLWQSQSQSRKAYELLSPIQQWFTEGFDTPDLKEANTLVDELALASAI
jgi:class 3 adenylate cyclase/predicted ATPase